MRLSHAAASAKPVNAFTQVRCGLDSAILGFATTIGPVLFYLGIFGGQSLEFALWATLITATVPRALRIVFGESPVLLSSSRAASLATYIGLVVLLIDALSNHASQSQHNYSAAELLAGLAAGSLMFALASVLILLCGMLKLGNVFAMIPTTVTAGISNSTALLLVWLAIREVSNTTWTTALAAFAMGLVVYAWPRWQLRVRAARLVPTVAVAVLVGLAISLATGPAPRAASLGFSYELSWLSFTQWPSVLANAELGRLLLVGLPGTVTLALVMILESFTAASVMETRADVRTHASRELLVLGGTNLVSAGLGGVPLTVATLISIASWRAGGRGALAAIANLIFTGVLLIALGPWLLAMPAGLLAGLYLIQAPPMVDPAFGVRLMTMIRTRQWKREGTADLGFWITALISLVGFFGSLIWACFVGIGLSGLAVLRSLSAKLDAQWAYLSQFRSHRVRSVGELANLERKSKQVAILRLTGHVFFGNSRRLIHMMDELHDEVSSVVVDVSQVHDVDASGLGAVEWLIRHLLDRNISVVVTGMGRTPAAELRQSLTAIVGIEIRKDLDHGLELCEEQILQNSTVVAFSPRAIALEANALLKGLSPHEVTGVLMLGDRREVAKGAALFHKDSVADGVWLLEEGTVSILVGSGQDEQSSRLATFGPGQFVGEMSLIDGRPRSATVISDSPVRALLLDGGAIKALEDRYPAAALNITRNIALELSHRVRSNSAMMAQVTTEKATEWANSSLSTASRF